MAVFARLKTCQFVILIAILLLTFNSSEGEGIRSLKSRAKKLYYGTGVKQDYTKALQLYLKAADLGDSDALYISGGMYIKGLGVERNFEEGFRYLHLAAMKGKSSPESQQILAQAYLIGKGTHKNYEKAIQWYKLAAQNGNSEAQNELGYMYFVGNGVEQDLEKGGKLFRQAAIGGMPTAQYNMGIMYYTGNGVEQSDLILSYAWMNVAAANNHRPAVAARNYLEKFLSTSELTTAQNLTDTLLTQIQQQ